MATIRTLIVDDEARIRRGIERLVQSCGEEWEVVGTASDGLEALDYFERTEGAVDLLITDVKMPEMDGLRLIREAKKRYSFHPLLISGYDDFAYLQAAIREGALDYLLKPVDREQFRTRMSDIRGIIAQDRYRSLKQGEMERESGKLARTRQIQTLSYITTMGIDMTALGYWVDEFPKGHYVLLSVCMDTLPVKTRAYKAEDWKAYSYALENMVDELIAAECVQSGRQGWSWRGGETDFWLLLHGDGEEYDWEPAVHALANRVRSAIQTYTPFSVSVAYGDAISDLYLLPEAKRQAAALMNYRFLSGGNQVFRQEGRAGAEAGAFADERELSLTAQRIKRGLELGSAEEAAAQAKLFFRRLDRVDSPSRLRKAVQNAIVLIHSAGLESRKSDADAGAGSIEDELRRVERAASLQELKLCVKEAIDRVLAAVVASRESGNRKPVEQAKDWIRGQLASELTIKRIADYVYMNPTYFSEVFKQQTGETVLDYVTRKRIERARELLRDPGLKLQDVCGRIGYQDVKYFSKLFKTWTGITPSKFRERMAIQGGEAIHGDER